jgi:hypothetical protein
MAEQIQRPSFVVQGELARLIPVPSGGKDSRETAATSALLASMMAVSEFAQVMTDLVGIRLGTYAKVASYTEVVVKTPSGPSKLRPDGLIHISTGKSDRYFFVETKTGNNDLDPQQVEEYLDLAKQVGVEGVITISNQYMPLPTMHPVPMPKSKQRGVDLYHWSWSVILTEAIIAAKHTGVKDPDQAYILGELIRFLEHPTTRVKQTPTMGPLWSEATRAAFQGHPLQAGSPQVEGMVSAWYQALRFATLEMSAQLGRAVIVAVSRRDRSNPAERMKQDCADLAQKRRITSELDVPDAASRIKATCDLQRRALEASMWLKAPADKKQVRAHRTWIRNQLAKSEDPNLRVVAYWPGRTPPTTETLAELRSEESKLVPDGASSMPTSFEVLTFLDLGDKLSQTTKFPDVCADFVRAFYHDVGQHLRPFQPQAPRIPATDATEPASTTEDVIVQTDGTPERIGEPPAEAPQR